MNHSAAVALGRALLADDYEFTTVTPATHQRVLRKSPRCACTVRDIFGWNKPFAPQSLPRHLLELATRAQILKQDNMDLRSTVRFATRGNHIFMHDAFPTTAPDAVFFGPDSYRFCDLVERTPFRCERLVDVGCGSGVGGVIARTKANHVVLADINHKALSFAAINADIAKAPVSILESNVLGGIDDPIDAVIANPPYMRDAAGRTYRDGGGDLGEGLALRIVREALARLTPGGTLILYTGSAVVAGEDVFKRQVLPLCHEAQATYQYRELDPDVFGEELDEPAYQGAERIAAVALVATTAKA
jgi:methylase of polypeptide subunit release factors